MVGEHLQGAGQQAVLGGEGGLRALQGERLRTFAAAEQQGEGDGLRVGVRELPVRRLREQQFPPVGGQGGHRGLRVPQRVGHILAQHPAQRRHQFGERLEIDAAPAVQRQDRRPGKEVAQQALDGAGVVPAHRVRAVLHRVAGQLGHLADALAAAVQRPMAAVAVEQVGDGGEAVELRPVVPAEAARIRPDAGRLEFRVAQQGALVVDGEVRAAQAVRQGGLPGAGQFPAQGGAGRGDEVLERAAQLLLRRAARPQPGLGRRRGREGSQGLLETHLRAIRSTSASAAAKAAVFMLIGAHGARLRTSFSKRSPNERRASSKS